MAVCILGALAASSCSKDEFFGLEDSEVLDYSTKYEIAMSQAYADYAIACFEMSKAMNQPIDTTSMEIQGELEGKPIYVKEGPSTSALALFEALKEKFPKLANADKIDYDDIFELAMSENKALKGVATTTAPKTKAWISWGSCGSWAQSNGHYGAAFNDEGWYFNCYASTVSAIQNAIFYASESYNSDKWAAGIGWSDGTAASMTAFFDFWWPSVINTGSSLPESDFVVVPYGSSLAESAGDEISSIIFAAGPEYAEGDRLHYIYSFMGGNPLNIYSYESYCFYY